MESLVGFFIESAHAQQGGGAQGGLEVLLLPVVLIVVFYFLLIRPQQKRQKEHRQMVADLSKGDEIVTGGGVLGKITEVGEQFLTVEIAPNVSIKVQKHTVAAVMPQGTLRNA